MNTNASKTILCLKCAKDLFVSIWYLVFTLNALHTTNKCRTWCFSLLSLSTIALFNSSTNAEMRRPSLALRELLKIGSRGLYRQAPRPIKLGGWGLTTVSPGCLEIARWKNGLHAKHVATNCDSIMRWSQNLFTSSSVNVGTVFIVSCWYTGAKDWGKAYKLLSAEV